MKIYENHIKKIYYHLALFTGPAGSAQPQPAAVRGFVHQHGAREQRVNAIKSARTARGDGVPTRAPPGGKATVRAPASGPGYSPFRIRMHSKIKREGRVGNHYKTNRVQPWELA